MCMAVPARVIEINKETRTARVLVMGNELEVSIALVSVKPGDYVLVHAGCALEVIKKEAAVEMIDLFQEVEDYNKNES